jgi:hypothetical protein
MVSAIGGGDQPASPPRDALAVLDLEVTRLAHAPPRPTTSRASVEAPAASYGLVGTGYEARRGHRRPRRGRWTARLNPEDHRTAHGTARPRSCGTAPGHAPPEVAEMPFSIGGGRPESVVRWRQSVCRRVWRPALAPASVPSSRMLDRTGYLAFQACVSISRVGPWSVPWSDCGRLRRGPFGSAGRPGRTASAMPIAAPVATN